MGKLSGKTALVTGASRGIGREIAIQMGAAGAFVVINYQGSLEGANSTLEAVKEAGGEGMVYACNIADYAAAKKMMEDILAQRKTLDILVNNAGITKDALLMKMTEQAFDDVIQVNLKGTFHCMQLVSRQMLKQRSGRIINISSVTGVMGNGGQVNYAASKAGVIGMTKSAARELASRGITVNAIAPGFIETDMTAVLTEGVKDKIQESIPMKRLGAPADVAALARFLATEEAGYITGQVICVDGGMAM